MRRQAGRTIRTWEEFAVPLSEEELRLLEQMERALVAEDPKFASTLRGTTLQHVARRRAIIAGVVFLAGVGVLLAGAMAAQPIIGIIGFLVMLASATIGVTALRSRPVAGATQVAHPSGASTLRRGRGKVANKGSLSKRMEDRWRRRQEGEGRGF